MRNRLGVVIPVALLALAACGEDGGGDADVGTWCDLNEEFWSAAGELRSSAGDDLEELYGSQREALENAADAAPDDVADDADEVSRAWSDVGDLLSDADYEWSDVDAADIDGVTRHVRTEVEVIQEFNAEECGIEQLDGELLPAADVETTDSTETTEPTESTDPTETTETTEPADPTETTEPAVTSEPAETTETTGTTEPADDTLPDVSVELGDTVDDIAVDMFEDMGLTREQAECLVDKMDIANMDNPEDLSVGDIMDYLAECDIDITDLAPD